MTHSRLGGSTGTGSAKISLGAACRTSLVALLSWLGLPLCSEAQRPTQNPQKAGAVQNEAIRSGITKVLRQLDATFNEADAETYLAAFVPDHPGTHAMLGQRLHRILPLDNGVGKLQRTSTIIAGPRRVGPRTVVRVRYDLHAGGNKLKVNVEDAIMAFRTDGNDGPVPTFLIATPREIDCPAGDMFRCPPCNYEIGGVSGWLCVPMGRDRSQSLEASSFYLLGTDLACDVSVRIDDRVPNPITLVEKLADALQQFEPKAEAKLATAWLPKTQAPSSQKGAPPELTGARIEIDLPATGANDGGIALFHVVQLGSLQHLLLVRGSKKAAREHRAALDQLLASFRVINANAKRAVAGARALKFHAGGTVEGSTYKNTKYGAAMTGPDNWKAQQVCAGAAFRVMWEAPSGARLWLTGYTVPPGMAYWCEETADHWLRQLCKERGLVLPAKVVGWQLDGICEATARTITCSIDRRREGADVPGKSKRILRIAFREDLLLVADGSASVHDDWESVLTAFATLRL